jgi:glycosyltransferase involved in cell wall biosynthesis
MIVLSHPNGNANVRAIANELAAKGLLYEFNTSIAAFPNNFWYRIGGIKGLSDFRRRTFDPALRPYTKLHPFGELGKAFANKLGIKSLTKHEKGRFSTDQIYKRFDMNVSKRLQNAKSNGATAVYAYEDGALETFLEAKKLGLKCIYDLPIAYHLTLQKLLQEEAFRKPEWSDTLGGGIKDSPEKLERKLKELELADIVVVASDFVRDSLPKWALNKKIIQSPFGTPISNVVIHDKKVVNKKLRVLFVGSMTQRKGLGDLFDAIHLVDNNKIELVVLGSLAAPLSFYKEQANFIYEQTRSHDQVLELMHSCDVFCLPSIVEGRALVMQEAMSQGLPIIITPNTGGEDLVIEGETGFLVPIRSPKSIANKLNWFLENRHLISKMGRNAQEHAAKYTWEKYAETIIHELVGFTNKKQ